MRCSFVLALVALAVSGCASHEKPKETGSELDGSREPGAALQGEEVDQTHGRLVTVTLRDARKAFAYEPQIDAIIPLVNRANARCGPITFATESSPASAPAFQQAASVARGRARCECAYLLTASREGLLCRTRLT